VKKQARGTKARGTKAAVRKSAAPKKKSAWDFPPRKPGEKRYWLLKQEPTDFSFDDLWAAPKRTTNWEGVRNFSARNFLRDHIKTGDLAFFYHSNADPSAVVGIVEIVRDGYPDATAFDPKSPYYDADSDRAAPRWFQVDVRAIEKLQAPVSLADIKKIPALANMALLRISQLSVQPVTAREWDAITKRAAG
jgi:predicted RNA-binding protein with PUA-like domain